jgi:hypothetical protein
MTSDLPHRPTPEAVEDALTSAGFSAASEPIAVLAAEVRHLRETVERCRQVMQRNSESARLWRVESGSSSLSYGIMADLQARLFQQFTAELAEALR